MESLVLTVSRFVPRPVRRVVRQALGAAIDAWLRTRTRRTGAPRSADGYNPVMLRLAGLADCRVPLTATLGNGMVMEVVHGDYISGHILAQGYYEPEVVRVLEALLKPGSVFFDVGAHLGQYTLIASRLVGPSGQVHSFEPDPLTFRSLRGNCQRNSITNVRLTQAALSDREGTARFHFANNLDIGSNSLAECDPYNVSGRSATVRCITLDGYRQAQATTRVDLVKMDVEGAELAALSGAAKLFSGAGAADRHHRVRGEAPASLRQLLREAHRMAHRPQVRPLRH